MAGSGSLVVLLLIVAGSLCAADTTNSWAVQVSGGDIIADELAKKHGFVNLGLVSLINSSSIKTHHLVSINQQELTKVENQLD